ncbi:MAG TPA: hypothetical protein VFS00_35055, partial [Polyangiaceae bacterium]|nr:hypothetical protein [Polyangiaceae bacterium]
MSHSPCCRRLPLAHGPVAHLEFCAHCQVVSLHLGALTLRLDPGAGESLHATLGEALRALREGAGEPFAAAAGLGAGFRERGAALGAVHVLDLLAATPDARRIALGVGAMATFVAANAFGAGGLVAGPGAAAASAFALLFYGLALWEPGPRRTELRRDVRPALQPGASDHAAFPPTVSRLRPRAPFCLQEAGGDGATLLERGRGALP